MNNAKDYNKFLNYKNGKLFFEGTPLDKLANKYKTPCYCYSVSEIESNYKL